MSKLMVRRTWPCGAQESFEYEGLMAFPGEDDKKRPCFLHGLWCSRGAKGPMPSGKEILAQIEAEP